MRTLTDRPALVLIVDGNKDSCELLKEYLRQQDDFQLIGAAYNGIEALQMIKENTPDLILLEIIMPHLDGLGVLERFASDSSPDKPRFIILTAPGQENVAQRARLLGADYFFTKPLELHVLGARMRRLTDEKNFVPYNRTTSAVNHDSAVTDLIQEMGVPAHFKGYHYLRDAILMIIKDDTLMSAVTKELYPMIAAKYQTTPSRVERAIRHAIEISWNRGNADMMTRYLGHTINLERGKPTNSEFIAIAADKLRTYSHE